MWSSTYKRSRHLYLVLLFHLILRTNYALKCRSEEVPSDAELKRVARNCMHKVSEGSYNKNGYSSNTGSATGYTPTNTNYYGQQNYGRNSNGKNYGMSYDNVDDDVIDGQNYRRNTYERDYNDDMLRQRNRERMQNNRLRRTRRATTNNDRSATSSGKYDQSNSSNNGRNSNGNGSSSNNNSNNPRSSNSNGGSIGNTSKNNNYNNSSNDHGDHQTNDGCIVHCFFDEMHMLNSEDYPDKYKVSYLLTKNLSDHGLVAFYMETIQDCFHYLESQRRREKCQFSRELISCMTEYAKANCDDWEDNNIMFN